MAKKNTRYPSGEVVPEIPASLDKSLFNVIGKNTERMGATYFHITTKKFKKPPKVWYFCSCVGGNG